MLIEPKFSALVKNSNRTLTSVRTRTEPNPSSEGSFPSLNQVSICHVQRRSDKRRFKLIYLLS